MTSDQPVFVLPRLGAIARHSLPNLVEGTIVPVALFLIMLRVAGTGGALVAALAWSYSAIGVRLLARRRLPGVLVLGAVTLTARTTIAVATGSVFVYFLQPTLGTVLVACAFLLSVPLGRPLAERLSRDFCPIPPELLANPHMRTFFMRISLLWAFVQLANAGLAIWLLLSQSVSTFVFAKSVISFSLTVSAIGVSAWLFKRAMARNGIQVVGWRHGAPLPV